MSPFWGLWRGVFVAILTIHQACHYMCDLSGMWPAARERPTLPKLATRSKGAPPNLAAPAVTTTTAAIPPSSVVETHTEIPAGAALPEPTNNTRLGMALQGSVIGCSYANMAKLNGSERLHCHDIFAANRNDTPDLSRFAVDPVKRAAFDAAAKRALILQQPFLAESPKNGCRPLVAHKDYTANGQSHQDYSLVLGCGKSF